MAAAEDSLLLLPALARSQPFEHVAHALMHKRRYSQPVLRGPLCAPPPRVMQKKPDSKTIPQATFFFFFFFA